MSDDLSGRTLGRYQVLERLGRGGMAEVYRAYQPSLDRYVALKVIYPHLADDPDLLERFGREARAVAALRHPNIVQVHDFDVQAGTAFMAMEFIGGPTLKAALQSLSRRGQLLPLPVVGQIVGQLGDALAYAHEQHLVHRDVKPANVLLRRPGQAEAPLSDADLDALLLNLGPADVVLTDFGVARIIKDSVEHTAAGTILGSPAYMSPEQGRGERVDFRSDIYSLGVVLYELLTGQVPFDADTPFAIVLKHTTAPLPPPRTLRPDLPPNLERLVLKALAKEPADRFQDASAFAAAVREQTQGAASPALTPAPRPALQDAAAYQTRVIERTVAPQAPSTQDGLAKPAAPDAAIHPAIKGPRERRGPVRWLMGCLLTVGLMALVAVIAFLAGGATVFKGLANVGALTVPPQYQAEATALAATMIADGEEPPAFFATPSTGGADITQPPASVATTLAAAEAACPDFGCPGGDPNRAVALLDAAIATGPISPELLAARALAYLRWDVYTYRDQISADIDAALAADPNSAVAHLVRGQLTAATSSDDADIAAALADFDRAVELAPDLVLARLARAQFLSGAPDYYDESSASRGQVIADTTTALAAEPQSIPALLLRGEAYYISQQYELARADFSAVIDADPTNLAALLGRGKAFLQLDDRAAAMADYSAAVAANPDNLDLRVDRASLAVEQGDYATALEDTDALVAGDRANPDWHTFRGLVRLALKQPDGATADFARALQLAGPDYTPARYGRGIAALAAGDAAAAIADLVFAAEQADQLDEIWNAFHAGHPQVFVDLAQAYVLEEQPDEAADAIEAAIEADSGWHLPYLMRARLRREAGDREGAREDLRQALELAPGDAERAEVDAELANLDQ